MPGSEEYTRGDLGSNEFKSNVMNALKEDTHTWSHDRLGLEEAAPKFKGGGKQYVLSQSPNLAKLNRKCYMNYS